MSTDAYDEACALLDEIETLWGDAMNVPEDRIAESDYLSALRSARNSLAVFLPESRRSASLSADVVVGES